MPKVSNGDFVQYVQKGTLQGKPVLISWPAVVIRARLNDQIDAMVTPTTPHNDRGEVSKPYRVTNLPHFTGETAAGWLPKPDANAAIAAVEIPEAGQPKPQSETLRTANAGPTPPTTE